MTQNVTATSITVCFYPPPDVNQNGPITAFNITYTGVTVDTTPAYQLRNISTVVHPLNGRICVNLTGLEEYNNYTIQVAAINGAGAGPLSPSITQLTNQAGRFNNFFIIILCYYYCKVSNRILSYNIKILSVTN